MVPRGDGGVALQHTSRRVHMGRSMVQIVKQLQQRPKFVAFASLWLLGMFTMFLAPPPQQITPGALSRYEAKVDDAIAYSKAHADSMQRWLDAKEDLRQSKTWFWWWSAEKKALVRERAAVEREQYKAVRQHSRHVDALVSEAKRELGLWSRAGLDEGRRLFWSSFESGKVFARRQTIWDTAINLITTSSSSDSSLLGTLVNVVCIAVVNFTAGMLSSIIIFIWRLPALLLSYQASMPSMVAYFSFALLGAISVILSYLAAIYAAGATAIYASASLMSTYRRLEGGGGAGRQAYLGQHAHEH